MHVLGKGIWGKGADEGPQGVGWMHSKGDCLDWGGVHMLRLQTLCASPTSKFCQTLSTFRVCCTPLSPKVGDDDHPSDAEVTRSVPSIPKLPPNTALFSQAELSKLNCLSQYLPILFTFLVTC